MIDVQDLHLSYGERDLFRAAALRVEDGERVALFGINGSGKSTFLKIVAGLVHPDRGVVALGRGDVVGYLPQDAVEEGSETDLTVFESACQAFAPLTAARERCEQLEHAMADETATEEDYEEYGHLHDRLAIAGGWSFEAEAARVLAGLGFDDAAQARPLSSFSGGWRMRVALARVLLARPTVLLLDEPTNHLDLESILWLEEHIKGMRASVLFISHDRTFVNRMAGRICELELGQTRNWPVPYERFLEEKERYIEVLKNSHARQQAEISQAERFIERFKATSTKSSQAMSRQKQLDKIERIELPPEIASAHIRFPEPPTSGASPFELRQVGKSYGDKPVFGGVNLAIARGDKVALVGPNGAGKSTLLHLLVGRLQATEGEVVVGHKVEIGLFAQYDDLPEEERDEPIGDLLARAYPGVTRTKVRTMLGALLFSGDDADKPYRVLSGGEKARVRMAMLLLKPHNVLLLDEPTNHLDLRTKEVMLEALRTFPGTVIFVSHDRYFSESLAKRIVAVHGGRVADYPGLYREYLAEAGDWALPQAGLASSKTAATSPDAARGGKGQSASNGKAPADARSAGTKDGAGQGGAGQSSSNGKAASAAPASPSAPAADEAGIDPRLDREQKREREREERRVRKRIEELEAKISRLEKEIADLDVEMSAPGFFDDYDTSSRALERRQRLVSEQEAAWHAFGQLEQAR